MRDLFKFLVAGIILFTPQAFAEEYRVLVLPDNIVTESVALDSYIYNASAEFFADDIVTLLNKTDYLNAPSVSEAREIYKNDMSLILAAKNLTNKFRTSYNIDYLTLKKLASRVDAKYVLLMTSYIDAENYILRRTPWDFLNIPGASVIDPAYKISIYAVLVDTEKNTKLWSDTYYKTISVCENRIITRGASPQTEQLQKIKDYSRYLTPQIAQNVQLNVLPPDIYAKETNQIYFDMGNIDNVFTKKYRHIGKEYDKVYQQKKADVNEFVDDTKVKLIDTKDKIKQANDDWKARRAEKKKQEAQSKLEVKATPVYDIENSNENAISETTNHKETKTEKIKNAIFRREKAPVESQNINYFEEIDIQKTKKNKLIGDYDKYRPELRDYNY